MLDSYDTYLSILKNYKGRLVCSILLCLIFFLFLMVTNGPERFFYQVQHHELDLLISAGMIVLVIFAVLSAINFVFQKVIPEWKGNKKIRLAVFITFYWALSFLGFLLMFEPFGSHINDSEVIKIIIILLFPPAFFGSAFYVYEKYVK